MRIRVTCGEAARTAPFWLCAKVTPVRAETSTGATSGLEAYTLASDEPVLNTGAADFEFTGYPPLILSVFISKMGSIIAPPS